MRARSALVAPCGPVAVELDLLLADLAAYSLLVGDGLLAQAYPFDGNRLLLDDRPVGVQGHLVLLLADVWSGHRRIHVRVGDRLAFDTHLFALDRHGDALLLRHDVLTQPCLAD